MRRLLLLMPLMLGVSGWVALDKYRQQNRLDQQLTQLTTVLAIENDRVASENQQAVREIYNVVARSHNQPSDIALLRRAEGLQFRVNQVTASLRACGNATSSTSLRQPSAAIKEALGYGALRQLNLWRQLIADADTLNRLSLVDAQAASLPVPAFDETTASVEVLSDLCQFESQMLARQARRDDSDLLHPHCLRAKC